MEGQPASPRSKLLEEIYVRGKDTVIRVSENAVLVTTSRAGGIQLPKDVERAGGTEPLVDSNDDEYENLPRLDGEERDRDGLTANTGRIVTDEDLMALADNIDDDWRTLALCQLNVPATDVESIIQKTSNMRDQKFCMFRRWKTRLEHDATVKNLVAAIDQHVEKDKWKFLIGDEDGNGGEMIRPEDKEMKLGNTHAGDEDEDARSTSTIDSVELEPLSLVNKDHGELADVQSRENHVGDEAVGLEDPNDNDLGQEETQGLNDDQGVIGDIERLSAVYTGFAEDKKDHFTSIGASMGDIMKKILTLDHENKKLKTENKRLKEAIMEPASPSNPDELQTRPGDDPKATEEQKPCKDTSGSGKHRHEDYKKLRHNYVKIKAHLKEAVEANREWETFCRNKRDKHEKEMRDKMETIKALEEKVTLAESSSADINRQMDSILNATENQSTEIMKDLKRVEAENKKLKHEIKRLTEEKKKVEKLSRELLKGAGQPSERDIRQDDFSLQRGAPPTDDWQPTDSYQEVLAMVQKQARAPPGDEPRKTQPKPQADPAQEDIIFLKEQVLQYRDDFERERRDREKAASDLESLRKELEHTQMLLMEQRRQAPYDTAGIYGGAGKYGGARREKQAPKQKGFLYMDPEEVEQRRSRDDWY